MMCVCSKRRRARRVAKSPSKKTPPAARVSKRAQRRAVRAAAGHTRRRARARARATKKQRARARRAPCASLKAAACCVGVRQHATCGKLKKAVASKTPRVAAAPFFQRGRDKTQRKVGKGGERGRERAGQKNRPQRVSCLFAPRRRHWLWMLLRKHISKARLAVGGGWVVFRIFFE
jgi:hypothetical protein